MSSNTSSALWEGLWRTEKGFASSFTLLLGNAGQLGSLLPAAGPAATPQRGVTCSVSHLGLEILAALAQGDTHGKGSGMAFIAPPVAP